ATREKQNLIFGGLTFFQKNQKNDIVVSYLYRIGGGKAYFHGDGRHIGCREQEETCRARPVVTGLELAPVTTGLELAPSPPVSNSSPSSSLWLVLGMEIEQRKTSRREA
ncbi:unnamed protein product, partial [Brassica napus]